MAPLTVALVSCGAAKLDAPAPARELYTSNLFRLSRAFAEKCADAWFILSARHGLLNPLEMVAPYELCLDALSPEEQAEWAGTVVAQLRQIVPVGSRLVILAGALYAEALDDLAHYYQLEEPLRGLGIGHRMAFLKKAAARC